MRIILCVTNDIATDQRVNRIALSLKKIPAEIMLVGTSMSSSMSQSGHEYLIHRIRMVFKKGPLFYMEYNIRLFSYLLFTRADILVANDLDTLLAVFLASGIKRLPLVYDSHEYFTELPELVGRHLVKRIWTRLESLLLPHVKYAYTVSASIASEYYKKYGISMKVVRNLPIRKTSVSTGPLLRINKEKLLIYQGSLNMGRGLELAIRSMAFLDDVKLIIFGAGYLENDLRELTNSLKLQSKIQFMGRILPDELLHYTSQADVGISLEENIGLNYYYALPNKLFDYIQAEIPVLVSDLPEMAHIVRQYGVGMVVNTRNPFEVAGVIKEMLSESIKKEEWKLNLKKAASELCWENEEQKLIEIYKQIHSKGCLKSHSTVEV